jgi:hypothetical protein
MAAFVRKVAIQINGLRRSVLFGGVCVNQGLGVERAKRYREARRRETLYGRISAVR